MLLAIEVFDELAFGVREAAWPLLRDDLGLSYAQIGLLIAVPNLVGGLVQPWFGLLADAGRRRALVLGGGVVFAGSLAAIAAAWGFLPLMLASLALAPASGAFVSLAQATLIDVGGAGPERSMARWFAAGSVGMVAGPLALSVALAAGLGWRETFLGLAAIGGLLVLGARRVHFGARNGSLRDGVRGALGALRRREVLRWLVLKDVTDLMGDVLFGFLALYLVDVVGVSPAEAALAVAVWTAGGLVGDFALLAILRRISGSTHLRVTAALALVVFPAFYWPQDSGRRLSSPDSSARSVPAGTRSRTRGSLRSFRDEAARPSRSATCRAFRRACSRWPSASSPPRSASATPSGPRFWRRSRCSSSSPAASGGAPDAGVLAESPAAIEDWTFKLGPGSLSASGTG